MSIPWIAGDFVQDASNMRPDYLLPCPCCKQASRLDTWEDTEVPCELCHSHFAIRCPVCRHAFDAVHESELFEELAP